MISASVRRPESMLHLNHQQQHNLQLKDSPPSSSSSRILDIPCEVCGDFSSGKHYNIYACDGCAGFFKRSIRRNRQYVCKTKEAGSCLIDKTHRNQCRACRLKRCKDAGMNRDAVQHERGPRNSTLKRQQMTAFFNGTRDSIIHVPPPIGGVPNLVVPNLAGLPRPPLIPIPMVGLPTEHPLPTAAPDFLTPYQISDLAARLIFFNVEWVKSITMSTLITPGDQLILIEQSWKELFMLGYAEMLPITDLWALVIHSQALLRTENKNEFLGSAQQFQNVLISVKQFGLDRKELGYLRAIALYNINEIPSSRVLKDPAIIARMHDDMQLSLGQYVTVAYPNEPMRYARLLLLLVSLRNVSEDAVVELFFRKSIGNMPIITVIGNVYSSRVQSSL